MIGRTMPLMTVILLVATAAASAPLTPSQKCEIAKNNATKAKYVCLTAQRNKVISGRTPNTAACEAAFSTKFAKAEAAATRAGGSCPVTGDAAGIEQRVDAFQAGTAQFLAGEGRFHDNGDGTITDAHTGLMWEKKGGQGSGGLHDVNSCYPWAFTCSGDNATVCSTDTECMTAGGTCQKGDCQTASPSGMTIFDWVAQVNIASFAGHSDWRIPTISELATIVDYSTYIPAISTAFESGCVASCSVIACSCNGANNAYWSSTSVAPFPSFAWFAYFNDGFVNYQSKYLFIYVRAVRAGA